MDGMAQDLFGEAIIDGFHTDGNDYLSNFFPAPIELWSEKFPTSEHAYQWIKTVIPQQRYDVLYRTVAKDNGAIGVYKTTAAQAKNVGKTVTLRDNWDNNKYEFMVMILLAKFVQNPELGEKLVATGDTILIEGNHWHDNYWGDCHCDRPECKNPGSNYLGIALMEVRKNLQSK